jgi:hypothetical protein
MKYDMGTRMRVYEQMDDMTKGVDYDKVKRLMTNTVRWTRGNESFIRFFKTDIIRQLADGRMIFNSGGMKCQTTDSRLYRFGTCSFSIFSQSGEWWLYKWNKEYATYVPFQDNMIFSIDGSCVSYMDDKSKVIQPCQKCSFYNSGYINIVRDFYGDPDDTFKFEFHQCGRLKRVPYCTLNEFNTKKRPSKCAYDLEYIIEKGNKNV